MILFNFSAIASKELTILKLVEDLQPDLLNLQNTHRCKAVSTIGTILEQLGPELKGLNEKEVELVTEFFCSKLKDHHSILPAALQGLHALVWKKKIIPIQKCKI
jgi:DNA repair/transcription protein MET18/MMS19